MAKRSKESFQKRAREKARQEKKELKKAKKLESGPEDETDISRAQEDALMQEFARLSARYEADEISDDRFNEERHRIFVELGLEPE